MNISKIRQKYKEILEEPESDNSEEEWQYAYRNMQKKRKKHLLT